jgi:hypothetical protein
MQPFRRLSLILAVLTSCILPLVAQSNFIDDFDTSPTSGEWRVAGDAGLFEWNAVEKNLEVTWDSSRTNSYFYRSFGTEVMKRDDFNFSFDLKLHDIAIGTTPGKPFTFQFAIGLINLAEATGTGFLRGTGMDSPNLVEFDYFPDSGFGATISPTIISSNMQFAYSFAGLEMTTNGWFHIAMTYTSSNQTLATEMTLDGVPFGPIGGAVLATNFTDFRVDAFAISSYSDAGQDPQFAGSIRAHGVIDNIRITIPEPPVSDFTGSFVAGTWRTEFTGNSTWLYTLDRTQDFQTWNPASPTIPGIDGPMSLSDTNPPPPRAFYRVRASNP